MRKILTLALAAIVAAIPAQGGTLEDFEKKATAGGSDAAREAPVRDQPRGRAEGGASVGGAPAGEIAESLGDVLFYGVVGGVLYGGAASWARVAHDAPPERPDRADGGREDETAEIVPRRPGEALIPFARIDAGHQFVRSDVSALDVRAEAGYAMAAVQVRRTEYRERIPRDDLATTGIHALYRMSFGSRFEMDVGVGALVLRRQGSHSGLSFTLPLLLHPTDRFGIEFRPAWSDLGGSTVEDYDVAILAGWRYVSARAGYRWVRAGSARLDGPEAGISVRW